MIASASSAQVKKACPCLPQLRAGDEGLGLPHGATRPPFRTLLQVFYCTMRPANEHLIMHGLLLTR